MLRRLKYLVLDVDGTLTDGGIYYNDCGDEMKKFQVKDGVGITLARAAGLKIVVMTGRKCMATKHRMEELHVDFLFQNVKNKEKYLKKFFSDNNIDTRNVGYIGDDLNDMAAMKLVEFSACPVDACEDIKGIVDYVSSMKGGHGAVREIIEYILKPYVEWEKFIESVYN